MQIGIEKISFYVPEYYLDINKLAEIRSENPEKYVTNVGQERMAVIPPNEDIVTMGATAANDIITEEDKADIDLVIFATESGFDQSKAAGIYVHQLLGLSKNCRSFEIKQACYGSTAAVRMAINHVKINARSKVLVIASDVSRYGLHTKGEFTQGAGAVAFIISAKPNLVEFSDHSAFITKDIMDFWSPNYLDAAIVEGRFSTKMYLQSLIEMWELYKQNSGESFSDFSGFCFHLPFSKMADKSCARLCKYENIVLDKDIYESGTIYNRLIGNVYTASLYISLISMLENSVKDLANEKIGLFAYGSGMVAEFSSCTVLPDYKAYLLIDKNQKMLANRKELIYKEYEDFYNFKYPTNGEKMVLSIESNSQFIISEINEHKRSYKVND